jgi:outer membrane receptor protein involved in Fe transport
VGNVAAQDPCSGAAPAASATACTLTGVSTAQYGHVIACPADTCSALGGGNRALKPEIGDTYTVGLVLTPKQIPNFSLAVDYYHIKVNGYISSIDPSLSIEQCVGTSAPFFCGLFHRDPRSGAIFGTDGYIVSTTLNTGFLKTSGIDVTADYTLGLGGIGKLNLNLVGT